VNAAERSPDLFRLSSREVPLNWNKWLRQTHRWLSIAFTVTVIANFVAMGLGAMGLGAMGLGQTPPWVVYSPLLPLALLLFTGLYMFALPYTANWRSGRKDEKRA
jgi:cellulose synthase/poly-beta-1,6-N-acetylglucosamine synthase-like glycosyltransferase